jgi:hypothetical protein
VNLNAIQVNFSIDMLNITQRMIDEYTYSQYLRTRCS